MRERQLPVAARHANAEAGPSSRGAGSCARRRREPRTAAARGEGAKRQSRRAELWRRRGDRLGDRRTAIVSDVTAGVNGQAASPRWLLGAPMRRPGRAAGVRLRVRARGQGASRELRRTGAARGEDAKRQSRRRQLWQRRGDRLGDRRTAIVSDVKGRGEGLGGGGLKVSGSNSSGEARSPRLHHPTKAPPSQESEEERQEEKSNQQFVGGMGGSAPQNNGERGMFRKEHTPPTPVAPTGFEPALPP